MVFLSIFVFILFIFLLCLFFGLVVIVLIVCLISSIILNLFINKLICRFGLSYEKVLVDKFLSEALHFFWESSSASIESILSPIGSFDFIKDLFFINSAHSVFIVSDISLRWVVVLTSSFTNNFKSANLWFVMVYLWRQDHSLRIVFQKLMWEWSSEECSVNVYIFELRNVNFFTSWAVHFKPWNF